LSAASEQTATIAYATANGTAIASSDYTPSSGTVTFSPGVISRPITVSVVGDTLTEPNETFQVNLTTPVNTSISDGLGLGTIVNDDAAGLTINNVTVTEGDAGTVNAVFTVSLSGAISQTVTVNYATANAAATSPADYTATTGTLTFNALVTSQTITVPVVGDTLDEANETFQVNLSGAVNATIADGQGIGTITDNDPAPSLTINNVTVTEGNSGTATATFTVTMSAVSGQTVSVNYSTASGTASASTDYTSTSGTLSFTAGVVTGTIAVSVLGDTLDEPNETFQLNLSNASGATIADNQGIGTITDDDLPGISVNDVNFTEGNTGTANLVFTVSLSSASAQTIQVNYATANVTATAPSDYTALTTTTLTFNPNVTSQTVSVPIVGDTLDEPNETFQLNLTAPVNATIVDGVGTGTITDNDPTPTLTINDITVVEGNAGTVSATFTVALSAVSGQNITVNYTTGNATATAPADYATTSGTLTFAPGSATTRTVTVSVNGDTLDEPNETFQVNLSGAVNATIADSQGIGTITDDDLPGITINDVTVTEGNAGTVNAVFTVSLSSASAVPVQVSYVTANATATAPADYTAIGTTTLTFNPTVTTQTVTVPIVGDTLDEANETFQVNLSGPVNAMIVDSQGIGTITDNDAAPSLAINNVTVTEGNTGSVTATFTVTLSAVSGQTVTVNYATANATATAPADYTSASGSVSFAPGTTTSTFAVAVIGDTLDETNETFQANLTGPVNATIADTQGIGTITDNDPTPSLVINNVTVTEGNTGTVSAVFTVTLSAASGQTVTVNYATANGTASSASDYITTSGTLTFAASATTQTITVPVRGDTLVEANETFVVNLSGASNATIADTQGVGTITNND
jgi:ribosomal protein L35AE/L33A